MSFRGNPGQQGGRGRGGPGDAGAQGQGRGRGRGRGGPGGVGPQGSGRGRASPGGADSPTPSVGRGRGGRGGVSPQGAGRGRGSPGGTGSPTPSAGRGRGMGGDGAPASTSGPTSARGRGAFDGGRGFGGAPGPFRGTAAPRGRGDGGPVIFAEGTPAPIPARLSDANLNQLVTSFKSLAVQPDRPLRPGWGTKGVPITLRANFFPLRIPKGPIYDYTVEITPKTEINRLKSRIFDLLELSHLCQPHLGYIAHDRAQRLVSARLLPQPLNIPVPFYEDGQTAPEPNAVTYTVAITLMRELDPSSLTEYINGQVTSRDYDPLPLISALNLVLQQHAARTGVRVGKNRYFFPNLNDRVDLSPTIEAWRGFYTSVRPAYKELMVNVNVCMTAFVKPGNLADLLKFFEIQSRGAMPNLPRDLAAAIKVTTTHLGYKMKKKLKAIATTSARNTHFDCPELGGRVSVEKYFKEKYKKTLKYPTDLPVVDIGTGNRQVYVPAELCDIEPGQAYPGRLLGPSETSQMIRYACNPPRPNAEKIVRQGFPTLGLSPVLSPADGFGLSISTEMAVIPARELPPPSLSYRVGNTKVANGSWNILDVKFHRGAAVSSWWVLVVRDGQEVLRGDNPAKDDPRLKKLIEAFATKMRRSGMSVPEGLPRLLVTPPLQQYRDRRTDAVKAIRKRISDELAVSRVLKPSFILVLLSNTDNFIYPGIKRIGDVELGVHTVHMQLGKAFGEERKQDQYLSNVALKVNTKLGGMNHLLDVNAMRWLTKKKTMMVGIDVTHPGPGSRGGTPSIAAVVASVDDNFVQFPASMRIQHSKKEMLDELRDMLVERLQVYEKKNKALPERIMVFRDGVSEGQFDTVLKEELAQILEACKKLETKERKSKYRPQLSIVICGKRHHARFFPVDSDHADRNGNTRPGTVVDKGVTGVFDFDFYLQAHAGLQGTVKPTHYTVVYDESSLGADELQQGTHNFSHLYARATKAVSLVPPAYYADLACERGRCYLNDFLLSDDKASSSGKGKKSREEEEARVFKAAEEAWGAGLHPDIRESMFYI